VLPTDHRRLSEVSDAMVELTVFIAFANFASRSNNAFGIESQGFSADCDVPLASAP
jgi:alkylhydroperoxidase family enzyme